MPHWRILKYKEEIIPILYKHVQKTEEEEALMRIAYLLTKLVKDITRTQLQPYAVNNINHPILEMKRLMAKETENWPRTKELKIGRQLTSEHAS